MRIMVINPIMYTSETKTIKRAKSIKDTMIYDLCLAFYELGHDVTLYAAEPFRPEKEEQYSFHVIWGKCAIQKICMPHCLPFMPEVYRFIHAHSTNFDLIISSEVFSLNSMLAYWAASEKLIVWHELAKHNDMFYQIPSKLWYGCLARIFMRNVRVVARSAEARAFICKYCRNTDKEIIGHGVNLSKFQSSTEKDNSFVVCSQLIERKKIDGILKKFASFLSLAKTDFKLYIIGDGELMADLKCYASKLRVENQVIFTGRLTHQEMLPYLSRAKAMLVNTVKDNSMISIVESIAVGTPVVTTEVPLNAAVIKKYQLGVADSLWDERTLTEITERNVWYVEQCIKYRDALSTKAKANYFLNCCMNTQN